MHGLTSQDYMQIRMAQATLVKDRVMRIQGEGNLEMRGRQTYMKVQLTFVEFVGDDGGGGQGYVGGGNSFPEVA